MSKFLNEEERTAFENDVKCTLDSIVKDIDNSVLDELTDDDLLHVRDLVYKLWRNI